MEACQTCGQMNITPAAVMSESRTLIEPLTPKAAKRSSGIAQSVCCIKDAVKPPLGGMPPSEADK